MTVEYGEGLPLNSKYIKWDARRGVFTQPPLVVFHEFNNLTAISIYGSAIVFGFGFLWTRFTFVVVSILRSPIAIFNQAEEN